MLDIAMSEPAEATHMPTNEVNQLLRQLLQKIEEIGNKEKETSARIEMLETASRLPARGADATTTPTPTLTPTTMLIAEASDAPIHTTLKLRLSLPYPPTFSGSKLQWRG
jgi:hypothetical protein